VFKYNKDTLFSSSTVDEYSVVPYKMKIWCRIYFGKLRKGAKLNIAEFSFIGKIQIAFTNIYQPITQKRMIRQIKLPPNTHLIWYIKSVACVVSV